MPTSPRTDPLTAGARPGNHFFCVPSYIYLWGSPWLVRFLFNPTLEVVILRLRGWCMLGLFLLLTFTRQRPERQYLLSPCNGMHAWKDYRPRFILSHTRVLWNEGRTHVTNPLYRTASVAEWLRRPPRERKIQGSNPPACAGIFPGSSHTSDFQNWHSSGYPAGRLA